MKKSLSILLCIVMIAVSSFSTLGVAFAETSSDNFGKAATWDLTNVWVTEQQTYKVGDVLVIKPTLSGNSSGLKFKYVWSHNDWDTWGITNENTTKNAASFKLHKTGTYEFYIDATDGTKTVTKSFKVNVVGGNGAASPTWNITGVSVTKQSTYYLNDIIVIKPIMTGNTSGLKYKFVWSYNDWNPWGITNNFSTKNAASFKLNRLGKFQFHVDVTDGKKTVSKSVSVNVSSGWKNNGATLSAGPYKQSSPMKLTANISGTVPKGAKYKFVYEYENWKYWKPIGESTSSSISFTPPRTGKCTIYVDITAGGVTKTATTSFNVQDKWVHGGVKITQSPIYKVNSPITAQPIVSGNTSGLKFKYVWSKNDWEDWKAFKNTSTATSASFTPTSPGTYDVIIDVIDGSGRVESKSQRIYVGNGGWAISSHSFSTPSPMKLGGSTTMKFNVAGYQNTSGMKYKFVAWNTTTDKWYILSTMTTGKNTFTWKPSEPGEYKIYMECEDKLGNLGQRILDFRVFSEIDSSVKVNLSNSDANVPKGKSMYLKKNSVSPSNAKITFVSDNTNVATVDVNKGYVYAANKGSAKIYALDANGRTAAVCNINVQDPEPVKYAYTSPNSAPKGSTVKMYAITDQAKSGARFVVNGKTITAKKEKAEGSTFVWSASISGLAPGTYPVKTSTYSNGKWATHKNGDTSIYVSKSSNDSTSMTGARRTSDKGIQFIKEMEGFSGGKVYEDAGGTPTIGYGKVIYGGDHFYNNLTASEGTAMLQNLVNENPYSQYVNNLLTQNGMSFNQYQFDSLVSFSFNKGASWTLSAYAYKYPLRGIVLSAPGKNLSNLGNDFINEFKRYHFMTANGKCMQGLADRRTNELELFYGGDYKREMPANKSSKYYYYISSCPIPNGHK